MIEICSPQKFYRTLIYRGMPPNANYFATENFRWKELLINQTEMPLYSVLKNLFKIAIVLQNYRNLLLDNSPIIITSGWRSEKYNKKIGGAKNSYHIQGMALDFVCTKLKPEEVQKILNPIHKGGMEFAPTWTHIDIRNERTRFDSKGRIV
jgi:zinc D-Ala-D-Ala carboxypeptidase